MGEFSKLVFSGDRSKTANSGSATGQAVVVPSALDADLELRLPSIREFDRSFYLTINSQKFSASVGRDSGKAGDPCLTN